MKRVMTTLLLMVTIVIAASAMSYSKARTQALYLTDKMGYELNLTDDQYDAAYEINLDYMMSIVTYADLYSVYWERRNYELQYVLSAYQYQRFIATDYFYRPITWVDRAFSFIIYNHYPKNRYFRAAPRVYDTYKGGNRQYQHSPYEGRKYSEPNRGIDHRSAQPNKSKNEAIKGGRQNQQNNSGTWRQPQGNAKPQEDTKPQGNAKPQSNNGGNQQGTFGNGRR